MHQNGVQRMRVVDWPEVVMCPVGPPDFSNKISEPSSFTHVGTRAQERMLLIFAW